MQINDEWQGGQYDPDLEIDLMKNPNLYIQLASSGDSGYLLKEDGGLILLETAEPLFR